VSLIQVSRQVKPSGSESYFWSGKNGDRWRTGASDFPLPVHLEAGPAWSWHEYGNGLVRAAPLIDGKKNIYLSSIRGNVYKFSQDGKVLWTHVDGTSIPGVPTIADGALFATNDKGEVFALDMETGKELWRNKTGQCSGSDTWSMTAGEGIVVAPMAQKGHCGMNNHLAAFNATDGSSLWSFKPKAPIYNLLAAIREGSLVFSDLTGRAYRLGLADGRVLWESPPGLGDNEAESFTTGGAVIGSNGVVYVTSNAKAKGGRGKGWGGGYVAAFSFADGSLLWRRATEYPANNAAAVGRLGAEGPLAVVVGVGENPDLPGAAGGLLRLVSKREKPGRILALDAATGQELWRRELPMWHGAAAGDTPGHVCLPDSFGNPAISGDGTVFVGFESGAFYAVNDRNHDGRISDSEVSVYDTKNSFQGSPGLAPGLVVATPCNGMHVFRTTSG